MQPGAGPNSALSNNCRVCFEFGSGPKIREKFREMGPALALGPVDWPCKQLLSPGGLPFRNRGIRIPVPDPRLPGPGAGYPAAGPGAGCRLPGRPFFGFFPEKF